MDRRQAPERRSPSWQTARSVKQTHPPSAELGEISPADFIPLAELTGDIIPSGSSDDSIKIDRSFVEAFGEDRAATSLVQAMLTMSRGMEMEVVAEGIETEEQAKLLRLLGCPYGQDYLFGRPAAAAGVRVD